MSFRVGIDLVSVADVAESLERFGRRYLERVFTADEVRDCTRRGAVDVRGLAARFAAKEATVKAMGTEAPLPWGTIAVVRARSGGVDVRLTGAASRRAAAARIAGFAVSVTHQDDHAAAIVLAAIAAAEAG